MPGRRLAPLAALSGVLLAALLLAACDGGDDEPIFLTPTSIATLEPTEAPSASPTEAASPDTTATAEASPSPSATPDASPSPTATAEGSPGGSAGEAGPLTVDDLRQATESEGWGFRELGWAVPCTDMSVTAESFFSARPATDSGLAFAVWTYRSPEDLQRDWLAEVGEAPEPRADSCELPTGFAYWNRNMVLVFLGFPTHEVDVYQEGDLSEVPSSAAVEAFLELTP